MSVDTNRGRNRSRSSATALPTPEPTSHIQTKTPSVLSQAPEGHRRGLPPWDRSMDAVYHRHVDGTKSVDRGARFSSALDSFLAENGRKRCSTGYFRLPDSIRLQICGYILAPHHQDKPIRLNRASFTRDVWRDTDLHSPLEAFRPVVAYSRVSFAFRADILLVFLAQNIFHATFSPYVGPRISPLATTWLNKNSPYMQNITLEVDMSRLGFGPGPEAIHLLTGADHIQALLEQFVASQLQRPGPRPLDSLVLLCRRFHGRRNDADVARFTPQLGSRSSMQSRRSEQSDADTLRRSTSRGSEETGDDEGVSPIPVLKSSVSAPMPSSTHDKIISSPQISPDIQLSDWPNSPFSLNHDLEYCPDSALEVCNHLVRLRSRIGSLRMCGFSESYTTKFIATLMPSPPPTGPERSVYRVTPSTIWPRLSGQKSFVDTARGQLILDDHDAGPKVQIPRAFAKWEGCVQLPPPILGPHDTVILPPVVDLLQRVRIRSIASGSSTMQVAYPRLGQHLELAVVAVQSTSSDRTRIAKLLAKYGRTRAKGKRTLSREAAATL